MSSTPLATALVVPFEQLRMRDVEVVGGKNASLGEMISQLTSSGVRVPGGFATTAHAFRRFLAHEGLAARAASCPAGGPSPAQVPTAHRPPTWCGLPSGDPRDRPLHAALKRCFGA